MNRTRFWQAFTQEGMKYMAKNKLNKVQYQIIFYICYAMDEDNLIDVPKKTILLKSINRVFDLTPKIQEQNFYKNFAKLEDLYIIRPTEKNYIPGYMMNPYISYKTGLKNYTVLINWLNLINAKPTDNSNGNYERFEWTRDTGFQVNKKNLEPYEPRFFRRDMPLTELSGYKYRTYFEKRRTKQEEQQLMF